MAQKLKPPDVFAAHDYRVFLKELLTYLESTRREFSMRSLAREAKIATGYLPMVLAGHRSLSHSMLDRLAPYLGLNAAELGHLSSLRQLSESLTHGERSKALGRIQKSKPYRKRNPKEFGTFHYLSHWYLVAIRELSDIEGFQLDAKWIKQRLREKVPLNEVEKAIKFLVANEFIVIKGKKPSFKTRNLDCMGGVYRLALGQFHKQMLSIAHDSIDIVESDARYLLGHTFALAEEELPRVKEILDQALKQISELSGGEKKSDTVYHVELAAVPLTRRPEGNKP